MESLIGEARKRYHKELIRSNVLCSDSKGIPSNADASSKLSILISRNIAEQLSVPTCDKAAGQTSGAKFENITMEFIKDTFLSLQYIRPGKWSVSKLGNRSTTKLSSFSQYEHLDYLRKITERDAKLAASLGNDYLVIPDIVVF